MAGVRTGRSPRRPRLRHGTGPCPRKLSSGGMVRTGRRRIFQPARCSGGMHSRGLALPAELPGRSTGRDPGRPGSAGLLRPGSAPAFPRHDGGGTAGGRRRGRTHLRNDPYQGYERVPRSVATSFGRRYRCRRFRILHRRLQRMAGLRQLAAARRPGRIPPVGGLLGRGRRGCRTRYNHRKGRGSGTDRKPALRKGLDKIPTPCPDDTHRCGRRTRRLCSDHRLRPAGKGRTLQTDGRPRISRPGGRIQHDILPRCEQSLDKHHDTDTLLAGGGQQFESERTNGF